MKIKFIGCHSGRNEESRDTWTAPQNDGQRWCVFALALFANAFIVAGCAMIPFTSQHPSFAMNSADCAALGPAIAVLMTASPMGISSAAMIAKATCDAESSMVAGQSAQITQTTTTLQGMTKATQ